MKTIKALLLISILTIFTACATVGKYEEALKEIYNLNIFLEFIDNIDLKTGVLS